jgi:hypothetical protein
LGFLDIEFESSWICSKTMKQGEWVQEEWNKSNGF